MHVHIARVKLVKFRVVWRRGTITHDYFWFLSVNITTIIKFKIKINFKINLCF